MKIKQTCYLLTQTICTLKTTLVFFFLKSEEIHIADEITEDKNAWIF